MGTVHKQTASTDAPTWEYPTAMTVGYDSGNASCGVVKRVLVGPEEGAGDFVIRHFTLPAGGNSALEHHKHQHGVVITHGSGQVLIGDTWHDLAVGDAVYVEPDEMHQFRASASEPLSFICVIPNWAGV
ncbi:MAG: cupin domain-containing protein [Chloroflexaceae bacterium]|nr:cupin domain-containing protein [Chloroflexaceae bacterium]